MYHHYLPEDLVREILSRVPATSLVRLRSTCKQWNDLFKDKDFIKMQYRKAAAAKQPTIIMLKDAGVYSMNMNLQEAADPSDEVAGRLVTLKDPYHSDQFMIDEIFCCAGLLLCTTRDKMNLYVVRLVVWNPCLGQTRWIEPRNIYSCGDSFALGYDCNNRYKILRFSYDSSRQESLEIYDYNLNSWKFLDEDGISDAWSVMERGISLNGNTYWIGFCEPEEVEEVPKLISFHFSTEKFERQCLPPFQYPCDHAMALSVVREEQLLLLDQSFDKKKIDIWVTTNNKMDQTKFLSWSTFLTVDIHIPHICFMSETRFFIIDEEKKIVVCCNSTRFSSHYDAHIIGEEEIKVIEVVSAESNNIFCRPLMFNYVPSLVEIQHE